MAEGKTQWTITEYLTIASFVFGLISTGFVIYITIITNDVTSSLNDEWQKEELKEVNARLYNLNVRERDNSNETQQQIQALEDKFLKEKVFDDFRDDNNRRWDNLEKDLDYLRSLKRFDVSPQPVYNQQNNE